MLQTLKQAAKFLPHPLLLRTYRSWHRAIHERRLRAATIETGILTLDALDLRSVKHSDTVFLLGSGPSINEISPHRWEAIARHDSIGFNYWPIHRVVPTIYMFESVSESAAQYVAYREVMAHRVKEYRDTVKIITDLRPFNLGSQLIFDIPPGFTRNLYAAATEPVIARDEKEFAAGLRFLAATGVFQPSTYTNWLFKYAGSVTGLISLALKMNYKRIVLCGIDLGQQHYFYQDPKLYPKHATWELVPRNEQHFTTRRLPYMIPAQQVLWTMKREILDPAGVKIYVENRSSTLFPGITEAPPSAFDT